MDKVKQVTASAQEAATEEARQQGLTGRPQHAAEAEPVVPSRDR